MGIRFDKGDVEHRLTSFLYPDDSDQQGRLLRVYQQYFMVSAGAQLILQELEERGYAPEQLADHVVIQINDTHPSMVIPELIRLLLQRGAHLRPGPGPGEPHLRLHQPHHPGRGPGEVAHGLYPAGRPPCWCPSSESWTGR